METNVQLKYRLYRRLTAFYWQKRFRKTGTLRTNDDAKLNGS